MELKISEWKEFKIGRLYDRIVSCKCDNASSLDDGDDINYIGAKWNENGVMNRVALDSALVSQGNCVVFILQGEGSAGKATYQPDDFIGATSLRCGYIDGILNPLIGNFLATCHSLEKPKYNHGRGWGRTLNDTIVRLPIQHDAAGQPVMDPSRKYSDDGYVPDWDFMEQYMKSLNTQPLVTQRGGSALPTLGVDRWKEFRLDRLFVLRGGFYNKKPEHSVAGHIPFLGSTENDNGVTEFYSLDDIRAWDKVGLPDDSLDGKLFDGGCVAVTVNGSVCNAFYQAEQFTCSHDITALYIPGVFMTEFVGLFIASIVMKDKYRWSYGRKPHSIEKFGKSFISLPVQHDAAGQPVIDPSRKYSDDGYIPDWAFMEQYIGSLPGSDLI